MTKDELIKALEPYPGDMDVFIAERKTEFCFGLLNSVKKQEINFSEEPHGSSMATEEAIILDEE